jgi:IS30 family transposase
MNEHTRQEIVRRWHAGASIRQMARELGLSRNTVSRALAGVQAQRDGAATPAARRPAGGPRSTTLLCKGVSS